MGFGAVSGQQIVVQEARFLCGRRILKFMLRSGWRSAPSSRSSAYFNILRLFKLWFSSGGGFVDCIAVTMLGCGLGNAGVRCVCWGCVDVWWFGVDVGLL